MKNNVLLTLTLFLPFFLFSQEPVKRADTIKNGALYLDFSAGLSQPLGNYASTDLKNSDAGFATPGSVLQLNLDWIGKNNFGLAFQYTYQRNSLSSSVKNDTLSGSGMPNVPIGVGYWTNHYLMAGLTILHFIHKVYLEGRALVGVVISSSPVFRTMDPVSHNVSGNVGTGYAGGVQIGVGYALNPRVTLKANIEYLYGKPGINKQYQGEMVLDTVTGTLMPTSLVKIETKRPLSALLIKAGVVIKLSK
jgi:opacity protein-like surface antigen